MSEFIEVNDIVSSKGVIEATDVDSVFKKISFENAPVIYKSYAGTWITVVVDGKEYDVEPKDVEISKVEK